MSYFEKFPDSWTSANGKASKMNQKNKCLWKVSLRRVEESARRQEKSSHTQRKRRQHLTDNSMESYLKYELITTGC